MGKQALLKQPPRRSIFRNISFNSAILLLETYSIVTCTYLLKEERERIFTDYRSVYNIKKLETTQMSINKEQLWYTHMAYNAIVKI